MSYIGVINEGGRGIDISRRLSGKVGAGRRVRVNRMLRVRVNPRLMVRVTTRLRVRVKRRLRVKAKPAHTSTSWVYELHGEGPPGVECRLGLGASG